MVQRGRHRLADPHAIVVVEACAAAFERVGLPEGLLLGQAALYLAGTEKSNSVLGFFDALKPCAMRKNRTCPGICAMPTGMERLRRWRGYRYPHAYAEHGVEQRYLPTPLGGVLAAGQRGWEGERRERMAERRAAQLAAAAELAADSPP